MIQAVFRQSDDSDKPSNRLPLLSAMPIVTISSAKHHGIRLGQYQIILCGGRGTLVKNLPRFVT